MEGPLAGAVHGQPGHLCTWGCPAVRPLADIQDGYRRARTGAAACFQPPHVHEWADCEVGCEDCGSHPGLRCTDPACGAELDLIRDDDPRE